MQMPLSVAANRSVGHGTEKSKPRPFKFETVGQPEKRSPERDLRSGNIQRASLSSKRNEGLATRPKPFTGAGGTCTRDSRPACSGLEFVD